MFRPPRGNRFHRQEKFLGRPSLGEIAERAGLEGPPWIARVLVRRQDQDARVGVAPQNAAHRLESAHAGHRDVDHQHIRLQLEIQAVRFLAAFRLSDDTTLSARFEQQTETHPHDRVIVRKQDGDRSLVTARDVHEMRYVSMPMASGSRTCTASPAMCDGTNDTVPPRDSIRSRMPRMPNRPGLARSASMMPRPSSATVSASSLSPAASVMAQRDARACLTTLVRLSCTTR